MRLRPLKRRNFTLRWSLPPCSSASRALHPWRRFLRGSTPSNYNAAEQVILGDVRQDEAEVALFLGERDDNVRAVDKVDLDVLVLGEEGVQAGLDGRDRDGHFGSSTTNTPFFSAETNG